MVTNSSEYYGLVSKLVHWITALLILGLLSVGFIMAQMDFSESKLQLYMLHKSFGLLVLALAFVRVFWKLFNSKVKSLDTHAGWEKALSKITHVFLYFLLFALPLSGWVMSSAGEFPVSFFGLDVPALMGKDEGVFDASREAHEIMAFVLIGLVGLHMAGAFKHHFIDRDATLQRMSVKSLGLGGGVLVLLVFGALWAFPALMAAGDVGRNLFKDASERVARADDTTSEHDESGDYSDTVTSVSAWDIDNDASSLQFTATQYGSAFTGSFDFDGEIYFDPENLEESRVSIEVDISSFESGSSDRDKQALSGDWFNEKDFPRSVFVADSFSVVAGGDADVDAGADANADADYIAQGTLTVRGVSVDVALPFSLTFGENEDGERTARMTAEITLQRLDFKVGQGQWESTDAIANDVRISIVLMADEK